MKLTDLVAQLENVIMKETNIPKNQLFLSFNGKPLKSDQTLKAQDISIGSVIDVISVSPIMSNLHLNVHETNRTAALKTLQAERKSVRPSSCD